MSILLDISPTLPQLDGGVGALGLQVGAEVLCTLLGEGLLEGGEVFPVAGWGRDVDDDGTLAVGDGALEAAGKGGTNLGGGEEGEG